MNVEDYLARINYPGRVTNTDHAALHQLCLCHSRSVPFENLDIFGGSRITLDLEKIYNKIVVKKRGGFCYENNGLFSWLLTQIGFPVVILQGQSYWEKKAKYNPEFDHMVLMVTCSDQSVWLVDMGWGGSSFKFPLKIVSLEEQSHSNGIYRLNPLEQNVFILEKHIKTVLKSEDNEKSGAPIIDETTKPNEEWKKIYKFDLVPRRWNAFKVMCNFQQDDDESFLKHNSVCCIQTEDGDLALWGWKLRTKKYISPVVEKISEVKTAKDVQELKQIIRETFGFELYFELQPKDRDMSGF